MAGHTIEATAGVDRDGETWDGLGGTRLSDRLWENETRGFLTLVPSVKLGGWRFTKYRSGRGQV